MEKSGFIAIMLLLVLDIGAQDGAATAESHVTPLENLQTTDVKEIKMDNWDDEFERNPTLKVLDDHNFEHDTQAATGQTTGIWLVLFWGHLSSASRDAESTLKQVSNLMKDEPILIATVNVSSNPRIVKRFNVQKIPLLVLFRDMHMYKYKGHWAAVNIINFANGGYKSVLSEGVPKEITYFDHLSEIFLLNYHTFIMYLANKPGLLAGVGSTLAMCCYLYTRKWLLKRQLEKFGRNRPGKRVD